MPEFPSQKIVQLIIEPETRDYFATLYALTGDGRIFKKVKIGKAEEGDWEEVEIDSLYETKNAG